MQQVFASANLVQISPANTNPELTQGKNWQTDKKRARTRRTSAPPPPTSSRAASPPSTRTTTLKKKKVFVVDDKQTYGAGLAEDLQRAVQEARRQGRRHRPRQHRRQGLLGPSSPRSRTPAPTCVYYGGQYAESGPLTKQLKDGRRQDPALRRRRHVRRRPTSRPPARPPRATSPPPSASPSTPSPPPRRSSQTTRPRATRSDYGAYGGYSYDAATAIIKAVKAAVDANDGKLPDDARAKVVDAVQKSDFDGVTGKVAFDQYGDTTNKQLTVYQVDEGRVEGREDRHRRPG